MAKDTSRATKQLFAFRANNEKVTHWRAYISAHVGVTAEEIATKAMDNYIKEHPLNEQEQMLYDLEMKKQQLLKGEK